MISREAFIDFIQRNFTDIVKLSQAIIDKGARYYKRPLIVAAACLAAVYYLVYKPPAATLHRLQGQVATLTTIAQLTGSYKDHKDLLAAYYSSLPKLQGRNRGIWLMESVRDTMKAESVSFTSLSPITEQSQGYYVEVSVSLQCELSYQQLASWIARLERISRVVRISGLGLAKDYAKIGMNKVDITISAVFPAEGAGA